LNKSGQIHQSNSFSVACPQKAAPLSKSHLDLTAVLVLVVLCASWGLQQVTIKYTNEGISPLLQGGLRSIGSSMLIWIWMAIRREPLFQSDGTFWWGLASGVLFTIEFVLIYWGLALTSASRAVIFLYTMPFFTALGSRLFLPGERMVLIQLVGLGCAFVGILAAFSESWGASDGLMLTGDLMMVGAAVMFASVTILVKSSPLARIKPAKVLLYQLSVSALGLPLLAWLSGEQGIMELTPLIIACLLYQIVWVAFITYLLWCWLIITYPASRLAAFVFLTPLFGVMFGALLLSEPVGWALSAALVLVAAGIYLVNRPGTRQAEKLLGR
jgi:drug/metabolite transporter (DMT)-like permease